MIPRVTHAAVGMMLGLLLAGILWSAPAGAAEAPTPPGTMPAQAAEPPPVPEAEPLPVPWLDTEAAWEVVERAFYKTVTFEIATNTLDLYLFASVLGGSLATGPQFALINGTAAAAIYYGHEVAWASLEPSEEDFTGQLAILKGVTYRIASTTRAFALGFAFTGMPAAAAGFAVASSVGETVIYIANEAGWFAYDEFIRLPLHPTARDVEARRSSISFSG